MSTLLLTALGMLVGLFGAGIVWISAFAPRAAVQDRISLVPVLVVGWFALLAFAGVALPWSFRTTSTIGAVVWIVGAAVHLGRATIRTAVAETWRAGWVLIVPFVCCVFAVTAFSAVQGDPPATVAYPGTLVSARVANLPPDHLFPIGAAQTFQHGLDPMQRNYFSLWDFSDRTPAAGAVVASVTSAIGVDLPRTSLWRLPTRELRPRVLDRLGFWQSELVLMLLNASVVLAVGRLAWSISGRRTALVAALLAAMNPFVLTHVFFTWPKMLAACLVLLNYVYVRERRSAVLIGGTAALAFLVHPLSALFVLPSIVVCFRRGIAVSVRVVGSILVLIAPWQIWTTMYAHPSRMLTYPLGYTMRDPKNLGDELHVAWDQFRSAGFGHALAVRWDVLVRTLSPFDASRNYLTLPGRVLSPAESWFTIHDRTLGGMALFVLVPVLVYGIVVWHRRARWEWTWILVAPLVIAVIFWGLDPQGLGAAMLQPTAAVLAVGAAIGLVSVRRGVAIFAVLLAGIEAATAVWWAGFSGRSGVAALDVAIAVAIWSVAPMLLLAVFVVRQRAPAPDRPLVTSTTEPVT